MKKKEHKGYAKPDKVAPTEECFPYAKFIASHVLFLNARFDLGHFALDC